MTLFAATEHRDTTAIVTPGWYKLGPEVLALGQKVRLIPGHCDPTVNLYDWMVCTRHGRVEDLWPITARGAQRA